MGISAELILQCFNPVLYRVSENRGKHHKEDFDLRPDRYSGARHMANLAGLVLGQTPAYD